MENEEVIWTGSPSQILNFRHFFTFGLWLIAITFIYTTLAQRPGTQDMQSILLAMYLVLSIGPFLNLLWKWLQIKCTRYELTNQRLKTRYGVLSRKADEMELYRVKDYKFDQPFFFRMFSLANIILESSDRSDPKIIIQAVRNAEDIRNKIRTCVEEMRSKKRVSEVDFEGDLR